MAKHETKTTFKSAETVISSEYLNKLYGGLKGTSQESLYSSVDPLVGGHVHDGQNIDGHAQKVNLSEHVTGKLPISFLDFKINDTSTFVEEIDRISDRDPLGFGGTSTSSLHYSSSYSPFGGSYTVDYIVLNSRSFEDAPPNNYKYSLNEYYYIVNRPTALAANTELLLIFDLYRLSNNIVEKFFSKPKITIKSNWLETKVRFAIDNGRTYIPVNRTLDIFNPITNVTEEVVFDDIYIFYEDKIHSIVNGAPITSDRDFVDVEITVTQYGAITFLFELVPKTGNDWYLKINCISEYTNRATNISGSPISY